MESSTIGAYHEFGFNGSVLVGKWIERESRKITRCPSYYAADYEVLMTIPGEYELRVGFEGTKNPYWILVNIPTNRVAGATFSGFAGNNFASRDLPLEPVNYVLQSYFFKLKDYVSGENVVLHDRFSWMLDPNWRDNPNMPQTWDELKNIHAEMLELNLCAK